MGVLIEGGKQQEDPMSPLFRIVVWQHGSVACAPCIEELCAHVYKVHAWYVVDVHVCVWRYQCVYVLELCAQN